MHNIFYNLRDVDSDPRVVVCVVVNKGEWARGIAICDLSDTFNERRGKKKAHTRAMYALNNQKNDFIICSEDALMIMDSVEPINDEAAYKAQYKPFLSYRENAMLKMREYVYDDVEDTVDPSFITCDTANLHADLSVSCDPANFPAPRFLSCDSSNLHVGNGIRIGAN